MKLPSRHAHCFALCTLLTLTGCSDSGNNSSANEPTLNKTGMCLDKARENPCGVLTEEVVRSGFDSLPSELKAQESLSKYHASCAYSWPGGRKGKAGSGSFSLEYDIDNTLTLSGIKPATLAQFQSQHRNLSEAEKAATTERINEAIQKKVDEGGLAKEHQGMGNDFASSMINNIQWQDVNGLGEAAAWGGVGKHKTLDIFSGGVQFSVLANIADDETENRDASVKLAEALLKACS